jgi:cytochrome P450
VRHGRTSASGVPLARLVAGNPERGVAPLSDDLIANEIMSILFAGTDTSATTLAYLFFELALHPAWYARLRAEVSAVCGPSTRAPLSNHDGAAAAAAASNNVAGTAGAASPDDDDDDDGDYSGGTAARSDRLSSSSAQARPPQTQTGGGKEAEEGLETAPPPPLSELTYARLKALPVLNAVLWETMRLHPAAISSLRRQVPRGGAPVAGTGSMWLPAGTVVSTATYTLQRDAAVFPQPDEWVPARWLASASSPSTPLFPPAFPSLPSSSSSSSPSSMSTTPLASSHGNAVRHKAAEGAGTEAAEANVVVGGQGRHAEPLVIYEDDAMRAHMHVFSRGIRACLGKMVALVQLKMAMAALAQRFAAVRLADERGTVADMRMTEAFALTPKGRKCMLVLE